MDFDITIQGRSFEEVERLMREAVFTYIDDALKEAEPARTQLLCRRAPLSTRFYWMAGLLWAALCGRTYNRDGEKDAAVGFAVACPA